MCFHFTFNFYFAKTFKNNLIKFKLVKILAILWCFYGD